MHGAKVTRRVGLLLVAGVMAAGCGDGGEPSGFETADAAYEARIADMTDCSALETEARFYTDAATEAVTSDLTASDRRRATVIADRVADLGCSASTTTAEPAHEDERSTTRAAVMPNVICMNLQRAQDTVQAAGKFFSTSHDALGAGRSQLIDSNWIVVSQQPGPGEVIAGTPDLGAVKYGEPNQCGSAGR
jgi:hypothetical protein